MEIEELLKKKPYPRQKNVEEKVEWRSPFKATLKTKTEIPFKDEDGKVHGGSYRYEYADVTYEMLAKRYDVAKLTLENKTRLVDEEKKKKKNYEKQLVDMGLATEWSPSLKKLQKQIAAVHILTEIDKIDESVKEKEKDLEFYRREKENKEKILDRRPK